MEPTQSENMQDQSTLDQSAQNGFNTDEYFESFSALKTSMSQGRDLKKKRKALSEYKKTLDTLQAAYDDRINIAENSEAIIREQEHIIAATQDDINRTNEQLKKVQQKISDSNNALTELKELQAKDRQPLIDELDIRNAELAAAKDELKQVKAQRSSLDLFDDNPQEISESEAAHDAVVEKINAKFEAAKSAQRQAQKALDAREKEERTKQKRELDAIKSLNSEKENIEKKLEEYKKRITAAKERISFCAHVLEHPEETEEMAVRIAENNKTAHEMEQQINQLASVHEKSKAASRKARTVVIISAVVLVIIVAVIIFAIN